MSDLRITTVCFMQRPNSETGEPEVMLARRKSKSLGHGIHVGAGGKFEPGIDIDVYACAVREVQEEVGVTLKSANLAGIIEFQVEGKPEWNQQVYIYTSNEWDGEPVESDEMEPFWFPVSSLPFEKMWESDRNWLPHVLKGAELSGKVTMSADFKLLSQAYKFKLDGTEFEFAA